MKTLGQRIRSLRKSKKMTLVDIAGEQMTKGMLSLIENDKAKPSIENLQYIANQLHVEVSVLTDPFPLTELRKIIDDLHQIVQNKKWLDVSQAIQVKNLVEPIIPELPANYEAAQIYLYYLKVFPPLEAFEQGIEEAKKAVVFFKELALYKELATTYTLQAIFYFNQLQFEQAYETIQVAYKLVQSPYYTIDPITRIDVSYHMASFCYATNRLDEADQVLQHLLKTCHEEKIFHFYAHIIRMAAYAAMILQQPEKVEMYRERLEKYTAFDTHPNTQYYLHVFYLFYYNTYDSKPLKVLEHARIMKEFDEAFETLPYIEVETGKALYKLGRFQEACEAFYFFETERNWNGLHPFNTARFQEGLAYYACTLFELGQMEAAKKWIQRAYEEQKIMLPLAEKQWICDTYNWLIEQMIKNNE